MKPLQLKTFVSPAESNHSFSGVSGDLVAKCSLEDLLVLGFVLGGELGHVRIYWMNAGSCKVQ